MHAAANTHMPACTSTSRVIFRDTAWDDFLWAMLLSGDHYCDVGTVLSEMSQRNVARGVIQHDPKLDALYCTF